MYIVHTHTHTYTHTPPDIRKQSQEYSFLQRSILLCYVVVTKGRQTNWNSRSSLWWSLSWAMEQRSKNWNRCSGMVSIYFPNILEMFSKGFWHWWKWMDKRGGGFPGIESQTQKYLSKLWNPTPSHKLNWHVHFIVIVSTKSYHHHRWQSISSTFFRTLKENMDLKRWYFLPTPGFQRWR